MDNPPMSSPNLELLRALFTEWERGDFFARADWVDPHIECAVADGPTPRAGTGVAGMATVWRDVIGPYENFRVTAEEYRELDARRVLVVCLGSVEG